MNAAKLAFSILGVMLGPLLFVYGGYDDSPGAQGLGLIITLTGIVWIVRNRKKS